MTRSTVWLAATRSIGLSGNHKILGGAGADTLLGGSVADSLSGGTSADRLEGNAGADVQSGGAGADKFVNALGGGHDLITDFADTDIVPGPAAASGEMIWITWAMYDSMTCTEKTHSITQITTVHQRFGTGGVVVRNRDLAHLGQTNFDIYA